MSAARPLRNFLLAITAYEMRPGFERVASRCGAKIAATWLNLMTSGARRVEGPG